MLRDDTRLVRSARQVSADVQDEAVILGLDSGVYFGVDDVGARIWQLLKETRTVAEIKKALLAEYSVAPEQLDADVREFLDDLAGRGLISVDP